LSLLLSFGATKSVFTLTYLNRKSKLKSMDTEQKSFQTWFRLCSKYTFKPSKSNKCECV
jgi:hypothetical protein